MRSGGQSLLRNFTVTIDTDEHSIAACWNQIVIGLCNTETQPIEGIMAWKIQVNRFCLRSKCMSSRKSVIRMYNHSTPLIMPIQVIQGAVQI